MTTPVTDQNPNLKPSAQPVDLELKAERLALTRWRKPVIEETSCALEINCYATSSGSQRRR